MWSLITLASLLAAQTPDAEPRYSQDLSRDHRALATKELGQLLRGSWLGDANVPSDRHQLNVLEWFYADGEYQRQGDNQDFDGRYRIANNQVCVTVEGEGKETCRSLWVDAAGRYWMVAPRSAVGRVRPITIRKIGAGSKADLTR